MKKKTFLLIWICLCLASVFTGGCFVADEFLGNSSRTDGPVIIGAVLPMTGQDRQAGERMLNGLRYAEYELNNRRGIGGRPMKLVPYDSAGTAQGAAAAFEAAAAEGAAGVIAGYSTVEAEAIAPLAQKYRIPSILPMATTAEMTPHACLVRNAYTDAQQGEALAAYLWYWRQLIRISVLVDSDPDARYERNTARAAASAFRDLGGTITSMPGYTGEKYEAALEQALITGPQAIIISARASRAARMVRFLREKGYTGTVCGLDSWDDPEFFRGLDKISDPGDCVYVSFFTPQNKTEEFKDFRSGFRQKYFYDPGSCETMSYDALKLLAIGLSKADTVRKFTGNWLSIRSHFGAGATYTMLPGGKVDRTMFINAVAPGKGDGSGCSARFIRSFMHSKLASYRY